LLELTLKEQAFVNEYFKTGKKLEAAINAGYSKASAHVTASRLLNKPKIQEAIAAIQGNLQSRNLITVEEVVNGLKDIAHNEEAQNRDRISAFNSLGRFLGIFVDKYQDVTQEALEAFAKKNGLEIEELKEEIESMKSAMKEPRLKAVG